MFLSTCISRDILISTGNQVRDLVTIQSLRISHRGALASLANDIASPHRNSETSKP